MNSGTVRVQWKNKNKGNYDLLGNNMKQWGILFTGKLAATNDVVIVPPSSLSTRDTNT